MFVHTISKSYLLPYGEIGYPIFFQVFNAVWLDKNHHNTRLGYAISIAKRPGPKDKFWSRMSDAISLYRSFQHPCITAPPVR